jgi:hypothetical protein
VNKRQLVLVRAALAALSQNATYDADVTYARRCLCEAVEQGVAVDDQSGAVDDQSGVGYAGVSAKSGNTYVYKA